MGVGTRRSVAWGSESSGLVGGGTGVKYRVPFCPSSSGGPPGGFGPSVDLSYDPSDVRLDLFDPQRCQRFPQTPRTFFG